jgi:energy-coupling factor transport system substrate-specific component
MLGALMFASKLIMEVLPNIHILGMLIMVYTIAFRWKALIPMYVWIMLNGLFAGFATWWIPYLYIWTILWGVTMLLPKKMPRSVAAVVYPAVCSLHGILFGVLYAPAQALLFGLDFEGMLAWIAAGFVFDVTHAIGNFAAGLLILPMSQIMTKLKRASGI